MNGYEYTVSEDKTKVSIGYYGYSYSHLDHNLQVTSTRTCQLTAIFSPPEYIDFDRVREDGRSYFSYYQATIHPNLMDSQRLVFQKVQVDRELIHVGTTSFVERASLKAPDKTTILATSFQVAVHVDSITRKKKELPGWFRDKYGHLKQPLKYLVFPDLPTIWEGKVKVHASHTDGNGHTNFATYVTYCEDAIYKYQKSISTSKQDWFATHALQEIEINYIGDSVQGDELQITMSQKPTSNTYFIRFHKNGTVIIQCKLDYCHLKDGQLLSSL